MTARIDGDLLDRAHELGLNVSKITEIALKDAIARMEGKSSKKDPQDCPDDPENNEGEPRAGIGPATCSLQGCRSTD